jgi:ATP-binding cassette subfamily A (ABC1) protein 5
MAGGLDSVIAMESLRKEYSTGVAGARKGCRSAVGGGLKVAVRNLSLRVAAGEVVGLLGHNGAGKTTSMRMVIQEEAATAGRVQIGKEEVVSNQAAAFQQLGYCPQFDAVWQRVTVREHLALYAALRGVTPARIPGLVASYLAGLRIEEHADKYSKDCSGGTKRKLSYAMSMLGAPRIVLLDEPSTGMDPQSKRFVWDTVEASFREGQGRGAILTTHSMEEADALCSRVGIMVKGELRCLGSTQHLKNKYGAGYQLEVKWSGRQEDAWAGLQDKILHIFPGAKVSRLYI